MLKLIIYRIIYKIYVHYKVWSLGYGGEGTLEARVGDLGLAMEMVADMLWRWSFLLRLTSQIQGFERGLRIAAGTW